MKNTKILALVLSALMILSLVALSACEAAPAETTEAETTAAPEVEETTEAPAEETTEAPVEETTEAPYEEPETPVDTDASVEDTDAPTTTEAPEVEDTEAPAEDTTAEAPVEETTEAPAEETTPVEPVVGEASEGLVFQMIGGSAFKVVSIGTCTDDYVVIPETYLGLPVTTIGAYAFARTDILGVTLPETVTTIEANAFAHCTRIMEIELPAALTTIGDDAFDSCFRLTDWSYGGTAAQWKATFGDPAVISSDYDWCIYAGYFFPRYDNNTPYYNVDIVCTDDVVVIEDVIPA